MRSCATSGCENAVNANDVFCGDCWAAMGVADEGILLAVLRGIGCHAMRFAECLDFDAGVPGFDTSSIIFSDAAGRCFLDYKRRCLTCGIAFLPRFGRGVSRVKLLKKALNFERTTEGRCPREEGPRHET